MLDTDCFHATRALPVQGGWAGAKVMNATSLFSFTGGRNHARSAVSRSMLESSARLGSGCGGSPDGVVVPGRICHRARVNGPEYA